MSGTGSNLNVIDTEENIPGNTDINYLTKNDEIPTINIDDEGTTQTLHWPQSADIKDNDEACLIPNIEDNTMNENTPLRISAKGDHLKPRIPSVNSDESYFVNQEKDSVSSQVEFVPTVEDKPKEQPKEDKFRITLEPVFFLVFLGIGLESATSGTLMLYKICHLRLHYPDAECYNITSKTATSKPVQDMVADYTLYRSFLEVVPGLVFSVFAGPWSDLHGRKPILIFPLIGFILTCITYLIISLIPQAPPELLMLSSFFVGSFGGLTSFFVGGFSYISDVSSPTKRTLRIAIVDLSFASALAIGMAISGELFRASGFLAVFLLALVALVLGLFYVLFFVKESVVRDVSAPSTDKCSGLGRTAVSTFVTTFKPREGGIRMYILTLILAASIMVIPFTGEASIMQLYVTKKFKWDQRMLTYYSAYGISVTIVGASVLFRCVLRRLKLPDTVLGLIGILGFIVKALFTALSPTGWILYLGATMAFFQPLALPVVRSMLTKMIHKDELGKIFAFMASCEAAVPLFSGIIYTQLYKATQMSFPGGAFLFTAAVMIIPTICFSWVYADMRRKNLTFSQLAEQQQQQPSTPCSPQSLENVTIETSCKINDVK